MAFCVTSIFSNSWVLATVPGLLVGVLLYFFGRWHQKRSIDKKSKDIDRANALSEKFRNRVVKTFSTSKAYFATSNQPWLRIEREFQKAIIRDINDQEYPLGKNWAKLALFDVNKEGIIFFDPSSISGYQIYQDKKGNWDVFHSFEFSRKNRELKRVEMQTYCTTFLSFSDITNIDWDCEESYNLITIYTSFKKTKKKRKKSLTYWYDQGSMLYPFQKKRRKNFKSLKWRIFPRIAKKIAFRKIRKKQYSLN